MLISSQMPVKIYRHTSDVSFVGPSPLTERCLRLPRNLSLETILEIKSKNWHEFNGLIRVQMLPATTEQMLGAYAHLKSSGAGTISFDLSLISILLKQLLTPALFSATHRNKVSHCQS